MALTKEDLQEVRGVVLDAVSEAYETLISPRFDRLETRMDRLEGRMDGLESRMDGLESRMDKLETCMGQLEAELRQLTIRVSNLETRVHSIDGRLQAVESDVREIYKLLKKHEHPIIGSKHYLKLTDSQKIDALYAAVRSLARRLHIKLPIA